MDRQIRILCAAIWYKDGKKRNHLPKNIYNGIVVSGWRHANCVSQLHSMFYPDYETLGSHNEMRLHVIQNQIQGFITSEGYFVNRHKAAKIAMAAGQVDGFKHTLYSEDLY